MADLTPLPPHLGWSLNRHFAGETVRLAFPIAGLSAGSVSGFDVEMRHESAATAVTVASLTNSVPAGQSGVQAVDPTTLDVDPPIPADTATWEAVIETGALGLPAGRVRTVAWIAWPFGRRVVSAGWLRLNDPAVG